MRIADSYELEVRSLAATDPERQSQELQKRETEN